MRNSIGNSKHGHSLRPAEDPAVYKWELEQALEKADPSLEAEAKKALLTRQFMKGLPNDMKIKLLEHDPTPKLDDMLSFVRRYRAVQGHIAEHHVKYDAGEHLWILDKIRAYGSCESNGNKAAPVGRGSNRNDRERNPIRR